MRVQAGQYREHHGAAWRVTLVDGGTACLHRDSVWHALPVAEVERMPLVDRDGHEVATVTSSSGGEPRWL